MTFSSGSTTAHRPLDHNAATRFGFRLGAAALLGVAIGTIVVAPAVLAAPVTYAALAKVAMVLFGSAAAGSIVDAVKASNYGRLAEWAMENYVARPSALFTSAPAPALRGPRG
jgi:hypothetical protein